MKSLLTAFAVIVSTFFATTSCKPETRIAGQPVSHWIDRLEDANPETRLDAWRQLHFASAEDIRKNRRSLEKIADDKSADAERATWLLFERLGEVNIKWISVYVRGLYNYPDGSAKAFKQLEIKDKTALVSALESYISDPKLNYVTDYKMQATNYLRELKKE